MAPLHQHNADCTKFLGQSHEKVNVWMDEYFATLGPFHRKMRHHQEGIDEARALFGHEGAVAAAIHVLRDCRQIPRQKDYRLGYVDPLGLKKQWSTAAYIQYTEEDFESLVEQLLKPTGLLLWSFLRPEALDLFLTGLTTLPETEVQQLLPAWTAAQEKREQLPPLPIEGFSPRFIMSSSAISSEVREFLSSLSARVFALSEEAQLPSPQFAYVPADALVTPLVYIDYEYLESLKPELVGENELDIIRFAFPETLNTELKVAADPGGKNIIFVSKDKALTVHPMQVHNTPAGTEVKFIVTSSLSPITVISTSGRLILRNGIHRAFMLAQKGLREIPCIFVKQEGEVPPVQVSAYPAFTPQTLMQLRPPLLIDFLNPELCVQAPLQRTQKMIRLSAEELVVPVD